MKSKLLELAQRLRTIADENHEHGNRYLMELGARAAQRVAEAGISPLRGRGSWPAADEDSESWFREWLSFVDEHRMGMGLVSKNWTGGGKITDYLVADWQERARDSAAICEAIAETLPTTPAEADNEGKALARMMALADDNHSRLIAIADKPDLTADDKLRAMAGIDTRFYGKSSIELGTIIDKTPQAVRDTDWWNIDRKNYLAEEKADRRDKEKINRR